MKKILLATMALDIGGAETHIVELAKELKRRGFDVIIASNGGVYVKEIEAAGIRHYTVPLNVRSVRPMISSYFMLKKIIKAERPDMVHAHARIPGFILGLVRRTVPFNFVTTAHWVFNTQGLQGKLTNWGDRTVAVSDDIVDYLVDNYGVKRDNITVTINGIDTEKFSPAVSGTSIRREFGIPASARVISHVSRLDYSRETAAKTLIENAEKIAEAVPGAVILIAGGGDAFEELKAKADRANAALGRKCVILAGPRIDINEIIAAGDIFVGVSRAALEAMACAKPVILAGNEGYMGVFTPDKLEKGIEGNFCCRGTEEISGSALVSDIASLFSMTGDDIDRCGRYGREVVIEHYSVARMADDTYSAYLSAYDIKHVVMSGYFGFGNAGDEAIMESIHRSIKAAAPNIDITVLSNSPAEAVTRFGFEAVNRFNIFSVCRVLKKCDALVFGGGSLLQDKTSTRSLIYYLGVIKAALFFRRRIMVYANGIGPITRPKNRRIAAKLLNKVDIITLRDPYSLTELREMGVTREDIRISADPVFTMSVPSSETVEDVLARYNLSKDRPYMLVSVRRPTGSGNPYPMIARTCDLAAEKLGLSVLLVVMQSSEDTEAVENVRSLMKYDSGVLPPSCTPQELMSVISGARVIIGMRLHTIIFAAKCAVPAAGIIYDPKVRAFLDMLGLPEIGTTDNINAEEAVKVIERLLNERESISARLRELSADFEKIASEDAAALVRLLKK